MRRRKLDQLAPYTGSMKTNLIWGDADRLDFVLDLRDDQGNWIKRVEVEEIDGRVVYSIRPFGSTR